MPRVRALSDDELDALILNAENLFARAAKRSFDAAARAFVRMDNAFTAAGEAISADDARIAAQVWSDEIAFIMPAVHDAFLTSATGMIMNTGASVLPAAALQGLRVPPIVDRFAQDHLMQATNRVRRFGDQAWMSVRNELVEGFNQGEGIDRLTRRVRRAGRLTNYRARTIARTEVISASNAGALVGAQALPPSLQPNVKVWLATNDGRTRPTHSDADGQEVGLNENFDVGGEALEYPGDENGAPEEVVNCRCTVLFEVSPVECDCGGEDDLVAAGLDQGDRIGDCVCVSTGD